MIKVAYNQAEGITTKSQPVYCHAVATDRQNAVSAHTGLSSATTWSTGFTSFSFEKALATYQIEYIAISALLGDQFSTRLCSWSPSYRIAHCKGSESLSLWGIWLCHRVVQIIGQQLFSTVSCSVVLQREPGNCVPSTCPAKYKANHKSAPRCLKQGWATSVPLTLLNDVRVFKPFSVRFSWWRRTSMVHIFFLDTLNPNTSFF